MPDLTKFTPFNPLAPRSKAEIVDWIKHSFTDVQTSIFGNLSYTYNPTDAPVTEERVRNDASIFLERVFSRVPRGYFSRNPKRVFVFENSLNAGRHLHFLLEGPPIDTSLPWLFADYPLKRFCGVCESVWLRYQHTKNPRFVKIEVSRSLEAVNIYAQKTCLETEGTNFILNCKGDHRVVMGKTLNPCVL